MPELLLQEDNPYGTRRATVLRGRGDTYLYLEDISTEAPTTVSAVWISNHAPAPSPDAVERSPDGEPARMAANGTRHPDGAPALQGPAFIWFEEGDGVSLVDREGVVAVIPGWGGRDGFYGYSRDAVGRTDLAWELTGQAERMVSQKTAESRQFWTWRSDRRTWPEIHQTGIGHLATRVGQTQAEWPIPAISYPPVVLTQHRYGDEPIWVTATTGLSAQRMASVEQFVDDPERVGRIELVVARRTPDRSGADLLAALAAVPFGRCTWLGEGHTIGGQVGGYPAFGPDMSAVLLTAAPPPGGDVPPPDLSGLVRRNDLVTYLWAMVIDDETFRVARGRDATAALEVLREAGRSWVQ